MADPEKESLRKKEKHFHTDQPLWAKARGFVMALIPSAKADGKWGRMIQHPVFRSHIKDRRSYINPARCTIHDVRSVMCDMGLPASSIQHQVSIQYRPGKGKPSQKGYTLSYKPVSMG